MVVHSLTNIKNSMWHIPQIRRSHVWGVHMTQRSKSWSGSVQLCPRFQMFAFLPSTFNHNRYIYKMKRGLQMTKTFSSFADAGHKCKKMFRHKNTNCKCRSTELQTPEQQLSFQLLYPLWGLVNAAWWKTGWILRWESCITSMLNWICDVTAACKSKPCTEREMSEATSVVTSKC